MKEPIDLLSHGYTLKPNECDFGELKVYEKTIRHTAEEEIVIGIVVCDLNAFYAARPECTVRHSGRSYEYTPFVYVWEDGKCGTIELHPTDQSESLIPEWEKELLEEYRAYCGVPGKTVEKLELPPYVP